MKPITNEELLSRLDSTNQGEIKNAKSFKLETSQEEFIDNFFKTLRDGEKWNKLRTLCVKLGPSIKDKESLEKTELYLVNKLNELPGIEDINHAKKLIKDALTFGLQNYEQRIFFKDKLPNDSNDNQIEIESSGHFINEIEKQLPSQLQEHILQFPNPVTMEICLLSIFTFVSSGLDNVTVAYDGKKDISLNISTTITAPPGSNKSLVENHLIIVDDLNRKVIESNDFSEPFLLSSNISDAAAMETLSKNGEKALIFDSEAQNQRDNSKQEWGLTSARRRKLMSQESEILKRKNEKTLVIKKPKVSFMATGTPDYNSKSHSDIENGLQSRYLHFNYDFKAKFKLKSSDFYYKWGYLKKLQKLISKYNSLYPNSESVEFILSDTQIHDLETYANNLLDEVYNSGIKDYGIMMRSGVFILKLAAIITLIDLFEKGEIANKRFCVTDESYKIAKIIVNSSINNSYDIIKSLGITELTDKTKFHWWYIDLKSKLSDSFTTKDINALIDNQSRRRQLYRCFQKDDEILRVSNGHYIKTKKSK